VVPGAAEARARDPDTRCRATLPIGRSAFVTRSLSLEGKTPLKIAYIRPPRHYWPILNESDNFLLPLAYPTLAAYLRQHMTGIDQTLLDCCAAKMGYASLRAWLREHRPDVVCIGEKVVYAHEAIKAFRIAREELPGAILIAGGQFFTHMTEYTFEQCPEIDFIVKLEGEETLRELLETLRAGREPWQVRGIAYQRDGRVIETLPRPLIEDLDSLPMPAYDLAGLSRYAPFGKLWPRAVTVQRSRGCVDECKFCSWWVQEGDVRWNGERWEPRKVVRSKSPERMVREIEWLYETYGIRYLFWVDATWNVDDGWLNEFCDEIIRRRYELGWWSFFRVDRVREQHRNGTLAKMVKAGLRHVLVGVERAETQDVSSLDKHRYTREKTKEAFHILATHYPEVFRQGTFITGLPDDDEASIKRLVDYAHEIDLDFAAFHPLTPFPGTPLWDEVVQDPMLEEHEFQRYDMFYPVMRTKHLSREQVAEYTTWCQQMFVGKKPWRFFGRLGSRHVVRRRLHWWFLFAISRVMAQDAVFALAGQKEFQGFAGVNSLWKPSWYES
jgi:anaerobic magnesium-protoporphyrin IX monomethyl ester cyclase